MPTEDQLPPRNTNRFFNPPNSDPTFRIAGDHRANEHLVLFAWYTIWLLEHNRLATLISSRLPWIDNNTLYKYARKVNIAEFQKVSYEEFCPAITARDLAPYTGFDPDVNPTMSDIFGGAAFRVGHTLVGNSTSRADPDGKSSGADPGRGNVAQQS